VIGNTFLRRERGRKKDLADASCGEEVAQALCLISLGVDEKILALEMVGVFEGGGKSLILPSIVFQGQGFCLEGAIEAWADFVGFAIEVQDGSFFSALGGCGVKFFLLFADSTDKQKIRPDSMWGFPKFMYIPYKVTAGGYNQCIKMNH
jgi:hypothetical protein